jgi:methenyltetrahydromethanopterin cyclohydrolase
MMFEAELPTALRPESHRNEQGDPVELNARAAKLCDRLILDGESLGIASSTSASGCRLIDCGIDAPGSREAGRRLAEICLADLAQVEFAPADSEFGVGTSVAVSVDEPVAACMASQYAGWQITLGKYFAMGSGPMRAAAGNEALFDAIGFRERPGCAVGVLETRKLPPDEVCRELANSCGVLPEKLTLLAAPTASEAGTVQIVARSVETALHKLFELGFDLGRVKRGQGTAPLPPVGDDDLAAIGRTNDAILYGGEVTLWVRGDDASLQEIGPRVPSSASSDFGEPFAAIFKRYNHDFYAVDPYLFSPALIRLINLDTSTAHEFGHLAPQVVRTSFGVGD